ncbi:MAG: metallophosphoesterase [Clostridia bacterium]|nr:metallophosphoesterase [Clostridia bacterium]
MRAIILSDSHGNFNAMAQAIEREKNIDMIIHAGDINRDIADLEIAYPRLVVAGVRGNNDFWDTSYPDERIFTLDNVKIFLTHGHLYGVKYSLAKLIAKGSEVGADICIFGHTHAHLNESGSGIALFNPGSASRHYGILETNGKEFSLFIKEL